MSNNEIIEEEEGEEEQSKQINNKTLSALLIIPTTKEGKTCTLLENISDTVPQFWSPSYTVEHCRNTHTHT